MADIEQKSETGGALMFAGLAVWVAGLLVLFYVPVAVRLGNQTRFAAILIGLAALGAVLMGSGFALRRKNTAE